MDWLMDHWYGWLAAAAALFLAAGLLIVVVFLAILPFSYYADRSRCASFGEQTGREVKFRVLVKPVVPISWDCFTLTADGKWIPTKNLREFGEQP